MKKNLYLSMLVVLLAFFMSSCRVTTSTLTTLCDSSYNASNEKNSFCVGVGMYFSNFLGATSDVVLHELSNMRHKIIHRDYLKGKIKFTDNNDRDYDKDGNEIVLPPLFEKSDILGIPYFALSEWRPTITSVKYAGQDVTDEKSLAELWFSPKNMLRNVTFDLKFGWQNSYSIFIPYINAKYNFHSVYTRFPADDDRLKNKIHSACFGGGIQLLPFRKKAARNQ
jgi:hypothetical protein